MIGLTKNKSKEIENKIVDEVIDVLVDKMFELTEQKMKDLGRYTELNGKFLKDQEKICGLVRKRFFTKSGETMYSTPLIINY